MATSYAPHMTTATQRHAPAGAGGGYKMETIDSASNEVKLQGTLTGNLSNMSLHTRSWLARPQLASSERCRFWRGAWCRLERVQLPRCRGSALDNN